MIVLGISIGHIIRVASRFSILVRYPSVFSRYFTNQYRRKTRSGCFSFVHLARTPFFPLLPPFDGPSPPFEGKISSRRINKKEFPQNFRKWSSRQILLQYKNTELNIDRQVHAGNLLTTDTGQTASTLASRGLEEPAHASRGMDEFFLQLFCCVSFWFWREIGFGFTYYYLCT